MALRSHANTDRRSFFGGYKFTAENCSEIKENTKLPDVEDAIEDCG